MSEHEPDPGEQLHALGVRAVRHRSVNEELAWASHCLQQAKLAQNMATALACLDRAEHHARTAALLLRNFPGCQ